MLNVEDHVFVTLKIDGGLIDFGLIKTITLAEGNGVYAPTLKIEMDDPTSLLSRTKALSDGNEIEIFVGKQANDPNSRVRRYRVFGPNRDNNAFNPNVNIIGVLNCPLYFTASARESYQGTSSDAIRGIAQKCGLTYSPPSDGRRPNDQMIWLDVCTSRASHVQEITRHGYIDDRSCMATAVTSYHEMRYRNLIDEINTPLEKIKYVFAHSHLEEVLRNNKRKGFLVKEAKDKSTAGVMTQWHNYGSTRVKNNIDGVPKNRPSVDVKTPGAYVAINQEVSDMVKRTRFDYAPIDCSNTHKHYEDAVYQNIKLLALFSETVSLLVHQVTDVQLFEPIIYRQADADPLQKVRNEDIYIVIGKTIVVRGGIHYAERIQCVRLSLTMKGAAELESSLDETAKARSPSIIPESSINTAAIGTSSAETLPRAVSVTEANAPAVATVRELEAIEANVPETVGACCDATDNLDAAIKTGDPVKIDKAMEDSVGPMQKAANESTKLKDTAARYPGEVAAPLSKATAPVSNTTGSINKGIMGGAGAVNSVISGPKGAIDGVTSMSHSAISYGETASNMATSIASAPMEAAQSFHGSTLSALVNTINSNVSNVSGSIASVWNTALSAKYSVVQPIQQSKQNVGAIRTRAYSTMRNSRGNKDKLRGLYKAESLRKPKGGPNWMNSKEMVKGNNKSSTGNLRQTFKKR